MAKKAKTAPAKTQAARLLEATRAAAARKRENQFEQSIGNAARARQSRKATRIG